MITFIDRNDGEVIITGCCDCPFCHTDGYDDGYDPYCIISDDIKIEDGLHIKKYFPKKCKLRKPNFKLTRIFKDE